MNMKQEKMKRLHAELNCLQIWLERGMVPKEDLESHMANIEEIKEKIAEEKERNAAVSDNFGDAISKLQSVLDCDSVDDTDGYIMDNDNSSKMFFDKEEGFEEYGEFINDSDSQEGTGNMFGGDDYSYSSFKDFSGDDFEGKNDWAGNDN